jgi:L-2,4-diaminobutyrate transaminase
MLEQGTDALGVIGHGWTYSAHPIGAAAGVANLKLVDSLGLVRNAGETGAYFKAALADAIGAHPNVGDIRGEGLLSAVEFVAERGGRRFFDRARRSGRGSRRRCSARGSSRGRCRRATSSASRRRSA